MNSYERPRGWNEAPQEQWVSGKPIGQDDIKMPMLGDPSAHEEPSTQVSFEDGSMKAESTYRVGPGGEQIKPGQPCPPGTETKGSACVPSRDPKTGAMLNQEMKRRFKRDEEEGGTDQDVDKSLKRDLPEAPMDTSQVRRLTKGDR